MTVISRRTDRPTFAALPTRAVSRSNLVEVQTLDTAVNRDSFKVINFCLLKSRSVRNKSSALKDFVVDKDIDHFALTETWLSPGNIDNAEIGDLCPTGYDFIHIPRESRGSGVGLLFKDNSVWNSSFQSFEFLDVRFKSSKMIRIIIIYRPLSSSPLTTFYHEFSLLFEELALASGELLIVRDFNIHVNSSCDASTAHFRDLFASCDLKEWVNTPTYASGHTLDLEIGVEL